MGERMYLGIDIGSSSSKAALLNEAGTIAGTRVVNLGTGTQGIRTVLEELYEQAGISPGQVLYTVVTGYGRLLYTEADKQITEITCHAKGIHYLMPDVRTVVDIGGQDSKVIRIDGGGNVQNFVMNEKCAAGTGRFLEVMARVLGCSIGDLSGLAAQAAQDVAISSVCTVFAESEVISQLSQGRHPNDVARGALRAVAKRVVGLCGRVGVEDGVAMSGGVALNQTMVEVLSQELGRPVAPAPDSQAVGAIGAALLAREQYRKTRGMSSPANTTAD